MNVDKIDLDSLQLLAELKKHDHAAVVVNVDEDVIKTVIVSVMDRNYAFYGSDIKEILTGSEIYWVPGVPEYIPGLINVRGDIESVIDIRYIINSVRYDPSRWQIVMAQKDDFRSGIIVDSVVDVIDVPAKVFSTQIQSLDSAEMDLFSGEIIIDNTVIPLIDVNKLALKTAQ